MAALSFIAALLLLPALALAEKPEVIVGNAPHVHLTKGDPRNENARARPSGGGKSNNGISYHGGPVMTGTPHIYYIWYGIQGGWTVAAKEYLVNLAKSIGSSPYYNIQTTYTNGGNTKLSNVKMPVSQVDVGSYLGNSLTDASIWRIVSDVITQKITPNFGTSNPDLNGVYFVLTDRNIAKDGFCNSYCGWHSKNALGGVQVKYSFVGDSGRCLGSCSMASGLSGDPGTDGTASIIAHELVEAVSDPELNAWFDTRGYENADKCAWTFGTTYTWNGAEYNMQLNGQYYLIQRNWVNAGGGYCATKYP